MASGAILATATSQIGTTNAPGILDFGSAEGIVVGSGNLTIGESIAGSGGLTKGGTGTLTLGGGTLDTATNTYSGTTTLDSGYLTLSKADNVISIPGDIVVRGGYLNGDGVVGQITNNANLTMYSGTFTVRGTSAHGPATEKFASVALLGSGVGVSVGIGNYGSSSVTVSGDTIVSNCAITAVGKNAWWRTKGLTLWPIAGKTNIVVGTNDNNGDAGLEVDYERHNHQPAAERRV